MMVFLTLDTLAGFRPFFDLLKGMRDFTSTNVSAVLRLPVQQAWTVSLQKASPVPFADIRRP
ncbi:hypothetical protein, partial [Sinanaerobacter chloroacetimidivorans]|uniref:hypothetical protein n=1 Tax=Sinanaerobacter chloroacetimidivorans TaxID=2818044 RepID=UPI001D0410F4